MKKKTDIDRLGRLMLDEFKRVNEHFERVDTRFEKIDARFDAIDERFDALESRLTNIEREVSDIRRRLDALEGAAANCAGFSKEIDHLLARVAAIEKHLGLHSNIKG
jgi:chromosome segregation ATPase